MQREKRHTYDLYLLTEGNKVKVAENVKRKILIDMYGLDRNKILNAAKTGVSIKGFLGKYKVEIHGENTKDKKQKSEKTIQHVSRIKTSSGCRFGG